MKMIKLSALTLLLSSTLAMAGGDLTSVEPAIEIPEVQVEATKFYVGLGYSCMQMGLDTPDLEVKSMLSLSATAGYNFNEYLAIEGRYTMNLDDLSVKNWNTDVDRDWDMSNIALYLKPQYTMNNVSIYGLIGYGQTTLDDGTSYSEAGFQYGLGLSTNVTETVSLYVDYRRLYDDSDFDGSAVGRDVAVNSFTVGANYNF
jgi:opacity protein-like surface antigen